MGSSAYSVFLLNTANLGLNIQRTNKHMGVQKYMGNIPCKYPAVMIVRLATFAYILQLMIKSSTEAELVAVDDAMTFRMWVKHFFEW